MRESGGNSSHTCDTAWSRDITKRMDKYHGGVRDGAGQLKILVRFQNYCLFSLHKSCKVFL